VYGSKPALVAWVPKLDEDSMDNSYGFIEVSKYYLYEDFSTEADKP
jgi:hypothetical protein